ncbi:MAG: plasmid mobilization protein [Nocardioidaceae bacterium]
MATKQSSVTERELAKQYDESRVVSDFDESASTRVEVRRNVTISIRFAEDEIEELRRRADQAGVKVTAFIRAAALEAAAPVDRAALKLALGRLEEQAHELAGYVVQGGAGR